jgi:hypothetical protein
VTSEGTQAIEPIRGTDSLRTALTSASTAASVGARFTPDPLELADSAELVDAEAGEDATARPPIVRSGRRAKLERFAKRRNQEPESCRRNASMTAAFFSGSPVGNGAAGAFFRPSDRRWASSPSWILAEKRELASGPQAASSERRRLGGSVAHPMPRGRTCMIDATGLG